jgi:hypothetical protein
VLYPFELRAHGKNLPQGRGFSSSCRLIHSANF